MKIAVSATGRKKENFLDSRFGRCEFFQIFDTETGEFKTISNNGVSSSQGAGIAAASQVIEEEVEAVITGNLGPNAFLLIEKAGIKAYRCEVLPVYRAIEMLQKNRLPEISLAGNAHHGM